MKLNEKGLKSFADQMLDIAIGLNEKEVEWDRDFAMRQIEFESDDFQGAVVLTVEEACEILDYLSYLRLRGGRDSFLKDLEKCNRNLYERIEQAEKFYDQG